jgi:hypothetical protein
MAGRSHPDDTRRRLGRELPGLAYARANLIKPSEPTRVTGSESGPQFRVDGFGGQRTQCGRGQAGDPAAGRPGNGRIAIGRRHGRGYPAPLVPLTSRGRRRTLSEDQFPPPNGARTRVGMRAQLCVLRSPCRRRPAAVPCAQVRRGLGERTSVDGLRRDVRASGDGKLVLRR